MHIQRRTIEIAAVTAALLLTALPAVAAPDLGMGFAQATGLPDTDIRTMIAGVIRGFMALLGLFLVMRIMWGGFLMMTHGGKEEKRAAAMATITNGIIGMVIIMSSQSLAKFAVDTVMNASHRY